VFDLLPLDLSTRAQLSGQLAALNSVMRDRHGRGAFRFDVAEVATHELGHAIVAQAEGFHVDRVELFDQGRPATSLVVDGEVHGLTTINDLPAVNACSDPTSDLKVARVVIAGRLGTMLYYSSDSVALALDELVLARWISDRAAEKLGVAGVGIWRNEVTRKTKQTLNAVDRDAVNRLVHRLLRHGSVGSWRLQKILAAAKRAEGGTP
jgi:hypothetical protein